MYENYRNSELLSKYSGFDFADLLKETTNNDYWKSKTGLWKVISGACNDAANKFYVQMGEYVQNLADIDTCNIHVLKSIAKSVNAEHLTDFINENYPEDLLRLVNLFSIKKNILLDSYSILDINTAFGLGSNLDARNILSFPENYTLSYLLDIKKNIKHIYKLIF